VRGEGMNALLLSLVAFRKVQEFAHTDRIAPFEEADGEILALFDGRKTEKGRFGGRLNLR
jgi:hypothetical protein